MSIPENHHYVPRSFFKPWENQTRKVVVYERKKSVVLPPYIQSTKSICVHKGLYSYSNSVEEKNRNNIEKKLLSLVDNNASIILEKLQQINGVVSLSDQDRYNFAVFIVSLRIRTPESFHYNAKNAEKILRELLTKNDPRLEEEEVKVALKGQSLLQWTEKYHNIILENIGHELTGRCIIDEKFVSPVMEMKWFVLKRKFAGTSFLSSDRPLILIGSKKNSNLGFALPISPENVFIASSNPESLSKVFSISPKNLIHNINISTIQQAKNKAFSVDFCHSLRFFENRLGINHGILPWT